ncbi:MAG: hypothetical protein V5B39_21450 [Accumulibacter sp.]|jgi:hypothetical protein|uniref:hypothetical protein n=1 Tax=Accumulibacter sp. TaxID=2053492 RepID=UPI002FC39891
MMDFPHVTGKPYIAETGGDGGIPLSAASITGLSGIAEAIPEIRYHQDGQMLAEMPKATGAKDIGPIAVTK